MDLYCIESSESSGVDGSTVKAGETVSFGLAWRTPLSLFSREEWGLVVA